MRWILTQREVAQTSIVTLWDTNLFRFYELKVNKQTPMQVSTGHANFRGSEAVSFWTQLAHVVGSSEPTGIKEMRQPELVANEELAGLMIKALRAGK